MIDRRASSDSEREEHWEGWGKRARGKMRTTYRVITSDGVRVEECQLKAPVFVPALNRGRQKNPSESTVICFISQMTCFLKFHIVCFVHFTLVCAKKFISQMAFPCSSDVSRWWSPASRVSTDFDLAKRGSLLLSFSCQLSILR